MPKLTITRVTRNRSEFYRVDTREAYGLKGCYVTPCGIMLVESLIERKTQVACTRFQFAYNFQEYVETLPRYYEGQQLSLIAGRFVRRCVKGEKTTQATY